MPNLTKTTIISLFAVFHGAVFAQQGVSAADFRSCAVIERNVDRLACYDALVSRAEENFAGARQASDNPAPAQSADGSIDQFGAELLDGDEGGPREIRSRLLGEFSGWDGDTEFHLENGQVWKQAERDRMIFSATRPSVTISRGAFGTYRLSVEGVRRAIRVRRIQ